MYVHVLCIYVEACTYEFEYVHTHEYMCVFLMCPCFNVSVLVFLASSYYNGMQSYKETQTHSRGLLGRYSLWLFFPQLQRPRGRIFIICSAH